MTFRFKKRLTGGDERMNIYKEMKQIAMLNAKQEKLIKSLEEKIDIEGLCFGTACLVSLTNDDIKRFKETGNYVDDDYFVSQHTGYCGDDFYGHLWFKTNVPGQYVRIYFSM